MREFTMNVVVYFEFTMKAAPCGRKGRRRGRAARRRETAGGPRAAETNQEIHDEITEFAMKLQTLLWNHRINL